MSTCHVVTGPETAMGFRLAGVEVSVACSVKEAEEHLRALLAEGDCGLLLVKESLLEQVEEPLRRRLEQAGLPVVVPVPVEMTWRQEDRGMEYLLRLIRRSIGYHIRIRK